MTAVQLKSHRVGQEKRLLTGIEKGTRKCGLRIEREAKQMCRVDTGRLRASISTNWTDSGMSRGKVDAKANSEDGVSQPNGKFVVVVGTNVEYAHWLEFGTFKMDARPFLFPAYEMNIGKLPEFIRGEIPSRSVIG
jgi:HK97 gp10 family phage protein